MSDRTWWATVAGSAIHEITEAHDLRSAGDTVSIPDFAMTLDKHAADARERGQEIIASGKVTEKIGVTGGPNKKDREWWLHWGPIYVDRWNTWREENAYKLAVMPDGKPGIEVAVDAPVAGRPSKGFIDRIFTHPFNGVVIVDIKTGAQPMSNLQLGSYRVTLKRKYGIEADFGAYWMAAKGKVPELIDLSMYSEEFVDAQYDMAWRGIEAGIFLPSPSSFCSSCPVRAWCRTKGGTKGLSIPVHEEMIPA